MNVETYQQVYMKRFNEAISNNEKERQKWEEYKKSHVKCKESLEALLKSLSTNCMVPVGKKAFFKGKLIHTNEIMSCIGDGYFVKYSSAQAIDLCNRQIQRADDVLLKLDKERDMYEMHELVLMNSDVLGAGQKKDLVEHWKEEDHQDWRVKHRQRQKEHKERERREREKLESKKESEEQEEALEDIFERLDQLELEEEMLDEMERLGIDVELDSEAETEEETEPEESIVKEKSVCWTDEDKENLEMNEAEPPSENNVKRRVSFAEPIHSKSFAEESIAKAKRDCGDDGQPIVINFTHSDQLPIVGDSGREIVSPADIARVFSKPKSILKVREGQSILTNVDYKYQEDFEDDYEDFDEEIEDETWLFDIASVIGEVQERQPEASISQIEETTGKRPPSKFKLQRAQQK